MLAPRDRYQVVEQVLTKADTPLVKLWLEVLCRLGYNGPDQIALFPPILLDRISTDLILACVLGGGNDLLTYYNRKQWCDTDPTAI